MYQSINELVASSSVWEVVDCYEKCREYLEIMEEIRDREFYGRDVSRISRAAMFKLADASHACVKLNKTTGIFPRYYKLCTGKVGVQALSDNPETVKMVEDVYYIIDRLKFEAEVRASEQQSKAN